MSCRGWLRRPEQANAVHLLGQGAPSLPARGEVAPSLGGQAVVLPRSPGRGFAPLGADEPLGFEVVEQRVKRGLAERECAVRVGGERLDHFVAVHLALLEQLEHGERGRAPQQLAFDTVDHGIPAGGELTDTLPCIPCDRASMPSSELTTLCTARILCGT